MSHSNNLCYEFGPFQLDLSQRVLTSAGQTISLGPKATEILIRLRMFCVRFDSLTTVSGQISKQFLFFNQLVGICHLTKSSR